MIQPSLQVIYKCKCMMSERKVTMVARAAGEDIRAWMDKLGAAIATDHSNTSPLCGRREMEYAKIPISKDESQPIGSSI